MLKKALIILLNLIFFVSTTGLPITASFCSMGKMKCPEMKCQYKHSEVSREHTTKGNNNLELINIDCCKHFSLSPTVQDEFVNVKTTINNFGNTFTILNFIVIDPTSFTKANSYLFNYLSPPQLYNDQIYLSNSILLI